MPSLDDIRRDIEDWTTRAIIAVEESRRTYLVPTPELAVELEALVAAHGIGHLAEVIHSPYIPPDSIIVMDRQAMEAEQRQALTRMRGPL